MIEDRTIYRVIVRSDPSGNSVSDTELCRVQLRWLDQESPRRTAPYVQVSEWKLLPSFSAPAAPASKPDMKGSLPCVCGVETCQREHHPQCPASKPAPDAIERLVKAGSDLADAYLASVPRRMEWDSALAALRAASAPAPNQESAQ